MEYRKFGSDYLLRIDKDEEILQVISELCAKEGITLGTVSGLGAVGEVTIGVFDRQAFQYVSRTYTGIWKSLPAAATSAPWTGIPTSISTW